ncbi:MAG TPA: hypothetical protein VFK93_02380 [Candidatus Limnocylindria bacterium]|jgi:pilus assembly protein CpaE|nr:hypothetical protein [Candidatus Limnocylindria bacterium]
MPGNPILLCAPTDALRQHLEQSLAARGYRTYAVRTPADAVAVLRDARYDLVVAEGLAVTGAIGGMRTAAPIPTPILVVARAGDVEARIAFLEAGADDVVAEDFAPSELDARIEALLIRSGRLRPDTEDRAASAANLVTFLSPKGGVGTTTLAVNTAVLLAMGADAATPVRPRVLLVDMDLQFGQVATHLNINPRFDLGGLAGDEPALNDPDLAASYLSEHSSGLSVLAAPVSPEADFRVTLDHVERIIGLLRPRFDVILVDSGSRLDQRTLWLLEQADTHVFVIFPEIAALRASSLLLGFLAETAALRARTLFVVNHIFPKELLKTRDIENLLRTRPAAEIPYTEVEMIRAVNEGIPVVMSRRTSPAAMAIERLARAVMGIEVAQPARQKKPERRLLPFGR